MASVNPNSWLWENEADWLVEVVYLADDLPGHEDTLDWIGRLSAFALVTNSRMLAQRGSKDPEDDDIFELWFSFDTPENKNHFLDMVRQDGYGDPDEEASFELPEQPIKQDQLRELRPTTELIPPEWNERIEKFGLAMSIGLRIDKDNSDA